MQGRIVRIISNLYTVDIGGVLYNCHARGKFRKDNITPLVGDMCEIDIENSYILDIKKRKNELKRPMIANVDKALVLSSVKEPKLSLNLLDKQLAMILINKIEPIIILSKLDLLNEEELNEIQGISAYYSTIGIKVINNTEYESIKEEFTNNLVVLTGQTGAGKSTLLNNLEKELNLKTSPISHALGRGVHTTRHVELFEINDGLVADTPGFSALNFNGITKDEIKETFIEFSNLTCKFKDCNHLKEIDCGVREALQSGEILKSRYDNYVKFVSEVQK